ncbi:Uncharacterized protein FWK35_00021722 [Aphis craccivora]|uniref:Uncharacterized protein n=1 Tax=Aphis craccivora TaxID=307492 RepID=A0A6G0ZDU6_APHCR|nr:Uncharacterized protein FWK35_00021722 [Aphis craccivora]
MMCSKNAPISNFGGGFRCKSEYPWCIIQVNSKYFPTVFKKIEKNKKKKMTEKREFLRKTSFRPNRLLHMVSNFYEICRKRENLHYKSVDKFFLALSKYLKI